MKKFHKIVILLILLIIAIFLLNQWLMKPKLTDEELRTQTTDFVNELLTFCRSRQMNETQVDFNNWEQSIIELMEDSSESRYLYLRDFASRASFLYEECKKRGLTDNELDGLVEDAVNRLGMERVAIKLGALVLQL